MESLFKTFSVLAWLRLLNSICLSLSSKRPVGFIQYRCEVLWKKIRPGAVRTVANYSSNLLFYILELLREDKVSLITPQVEGDYWGPQMSPGMILINLDSWLKWPCYIYLLHWWGFNLPTFMLGSLMGKKLIWVGKRSAPLEGLLRTRSFGWITGKWRHLF